MPEVNNTSYADVNEDGSIEGLSASFVEVEGITPRVDGIRTRFYEAGDGPPLLLLHGGGWIGSSNANTWSRVIEGLSQYFRVLAVDRLGCGMTENPEREKDFVYDAELEHMISFLNTVGVNEFHVCGQSRGGGLAGRVTAEIPDRVKSLIVVNSATLSPIAPNKFFFFARALSDDLDEESPTYQEDAYRERYSVHEYSAHHVTDEFVRAAAYMRTRPKALETAEVWENRGGEERWVDSLLDHMSYVHLRLQKGELQMPMLVYWGRNDPTVPLMSGIGLYELMARGNPRVEMDIIERAGHHPYREYPEAFVDRITSYVEFLEKYGYDYGVPETTYEPE